MLQDKHREKPTARWGVRGHEQINARPCALSVRVPVHTTLGAWANYNYPPGDSKASPPYRVLPPSSNLRLQESLSALAEGYLEAANRCARIDLEKKASETRCRALRGAAVRVQRRRSAELNHTRLPRRRDKGRLHTALGGYTRYTTSPPPETLSNHRGPLRGRLRRCIPACSVLLRSRPRSSLCRPQWQIAAPHRPLRS